MRGLTVWFIYLNLAITLIYDLIVFFWGGGEATISVYMWELPSRSPELFAFWCWGLGVLTCHLVPILRAHRVHVIEVGK